MRLATLDRRRSLTTASLCTAASQLPFTLARNRDLVGIVTEIQSFVLALRGPDNWVAETPATSLARAAHL